MEASQKPSPSLFLRKGVGWHRVESVIDVVIQSGKFQLDNGQEINGDMLAIIMKFERYDDGQVALRKLREMEPRIVDIRITGAVETDLSVILCGDEVSETDPSRYAIMGRVLGMRPVGVEPEAAGRGGNVV